MGSITDDRGCRRAVMWVDDLTPSAESDARREAVIEDMRGVAETRLLDRVSLAYAGMVAVHFVIFICVMAIGVAINLSTSVGIWIAFGVTMVSFCLCNWGRGHDGLRRAKVIALESGMCPCCVYPFGSASEPDGCVVCTECGAAWKLRAGEGESEGA